MPADFARVGGGKAKKGRTVPEGYVRADSLDKKKLQKYIKGVATEAEMYRDPRKNALLLCITFQKKFLHITC